MNKNKLLIIEDDLLTQQSLMQQAAEDFSTVYTTSTLEEAREVIEHQPITAILSDYILPDGDALTFFRSLNIRERTLPIAILTGHASQNMAIEAVNTGIHCFMEKPASTNEIKQFFQYCRTFTSRAFFIRDFLYRGSIFSRTKEFLKTNFNLSDREIEVIEKLLVYDKNKIVAAKLHISPGTVKRHLQNIFAKLDISRKEQLKRLIFDKNMEFKVLYSSGFSRVITKDLLQ